MNSAKLFIYNHFEKFETSDGLSSDEVKDISLNLGKIASPVCAYVCLSTLNCLDCKLFGSDTLTVCIAFGRMELLSWLGS